MNTISHRYQETLQQLRECYDTHAEKFSSTRKKHRPEFERIANKLKVDNQTSKIKDSQSVIRNPALSIIELGCGDGRLYPYLIQQ